MAPGLDGESIGIPAYLLLKQSRDGLLDLVLVKCDEGLLGRTRLVRTNCDGHEAGSVAGLEGSLTSASGATLLASVGEESSGLFIWEPF
jgi:hypothetical protein